MCSAALKSVTKTVCETVRDGLDPVAEDGWTQAQYATAVRQILAGPENAVPAAVLRAKLGSEGAGKKVLQAMVRADLLTYRPYSSWARDISQSAFKQDGPVITAPTPAHLACMHRLELPEPEPSADTVSCATPCNCMEYAWHVRA